MSNFKLGKRSKVKLYGDNNHSPVHPKLAELVVMALGYSTVDFGVIDGFRTVEEQSGMFKAKHSMLDGVVRKSDHQIGMAVDLLPVVNSNGVRLDPFDVENIHVARAWLEVYRAIMCASMKLGLVVEFGLGYNIHHGRDWPHLSLKGLVPTNHSGMVGSDLTN